MIKMQVIGHLGKDAITNDVNGKKVINFTVAHTEKIRTQDGNSTDKTIWVDCAYWTDKVAIAPYLKKGTQVWVEGGPDVRNYTKADGTHGSTLTLRVLQVQLLGAKGDGEGSASINTTQNYQPQAAAQKMPTTPPPAATPFDDDLPF